MTIGLVRRSSCLLLLTLTIVIGCSGAGHKEPGAGATPDDFHWGEPACGGLAAGIALESSEPHQPIAYRLALTNRSASAKQVTLFATLPGLYRLRVIGRQEGVEAGRAAVYHRLRVTNDYALTETLAPGQMMKERGDPVDFGDRFSGEGTLHVVFSTAKAGRQLGSFEPEESDAWCHVRSAEIPVTFSSGANKMRERTWKMRQKAWEPHLGKEITVEGKAWNAKVGASVEVEGMGSIYIERLDHWPMKVGNGVRVRVRGTVIKDQDLPVFIEYPGAPPMGGIPVPPGTDLEEAATRYLLRDAKWEEIVPGAGDR